MPELPEVEIVARQLARLVEGRRLLRVESFDPKLQIERPEATLGRVIRTVRRLGKQVVIELADPANGAAPLWLCVHLRMTGRLVWASACEEPPAPPLRARLTLDDGVILFKDARRFGTMRLTASQDAVHPGGLDPLAEGFTPAALAERLAGCRQELKPWLLRQDRLAGLGNIYAAEALFAARLSPRRPAGSLSRAEVRRLHGTILRILRLGIKWGGTTLSDFVDARGKSGEFQRHLAVYGRAGQPCRRCAAPIKRYVQQGRSTFYCPRCQEPNGKSKI